MTNCFDLYLGSESDASGQAFFYGKAPKIASLDSWDMYSLNRRRRVMGLQCMTLLMMKQLHSASYKVSGMGHGSSYYAFFFFSVHFYKFFCRW